MITITHENAHEQEVHRFVAFASDLGLRPGQFPETLPTDLGNRQPFLRGKVATRDGDVVAVGYEQLLGCITLSLLND